MKTHIGINGIPPFKIVGTNSDLQHFENECRRKGLAVSKANSYFRSDYEHCLMPAYAYDDAQPTNIKLQTLSADVYYPATVYDLKYGFSLPLSMVEVINQAAIA